MIQPLKTLVTQVRGATLDLVQGVPDDWLTWSPEGTANHILWHAGHALCVQEVLTLQPVAGGDRLPAGWAETFGQDCRPVAATTEWPTRTELADLLKQQMTRALETLEEHADDLASTPQREPAGAGWPLLDGIVHGWHDEARHQGEMYLLFKLQRGAAARS